MKKFAVIAALVLVAYLMFFQDAFDTDLQLNGQTFSHVSKVGGGNVTNHFYTLGGESFQTATSSIQIVELGENLQDKSTRRDRLNPLFARYNLTPVDDQPLEASGRIEKAGVIFWSYSAPISVKGIEHQAFYLITTDAKSNGRAPAKAKDIIRQLKGLGTYME